MACDVLWCARKQFLLACPSGKMNRKKFFKFYRTLRVESEEKVKEIANFVFTAFDRDANGKIDFSEFLCMLIGCCSAGRSHWAHACFFSLQVATLSHRWERCVRNLIMSLPFTTKIRIIRSIGRKWSESSRPCTIYLANQETTIHLSVAPKTSSRWSTSTTIDR